MKKLLLVLLVALAYATGASAQGKAEAEANVEITARTEEMTLPVTNKPIYGAGNQRKAVKPRKTTGRRIIGYNSSVTIPPQNVRIDATALAKATAAQTEPLERGLGDLNDRLEAEIETRQKMDQKLLTAVEKIAVQTNQNTADINELKQNQQSMVTRNEFDQTVADLKKRDPGKLHRWINTGLAIYGIVRAEQANRRSTTVNNQSRYNRGNGNNNDNANGGVNCSRYVVKRGCYNPPVGGNCNDRTGNCNYNTSNGSGSKPISVPNGSGSDNGNFNGVNSNNTGRRAIVRSNNQVSTSGNGGGTYNNAVSGDNRGGRQY